MNADDFQPPDSRVRKRADELAAEAYDEHLHGHGMRTWAIAVAVARHERLDPDPEALYVACLLHDLGLTHVHDGPEPFELRGADAAAAVYDDDARRAAVVHEAIAMHTDLSSVFGPAEQRLVQSGSGGDLVGLDQELVHPQTRALIARRWPRSSGFADDVVGRLRAHTRPHPNSPGAGLLAVGFGGRVRAHARPS